MPPNQPIQWIFFDIGSTLVDEANAYRRRIRDTVAGSSVSEDAFYETMLRFYRQSKKGDKEAARTFGLTLAPWPSQDERLYPEAEDCLCRLSTRFSLGVIANQPPGTAERLHAFGLDKYIRLIVASAEEGIAKPDPHIFQLALERADCTPRSAAMVGDRLDNDIAPANMLGMTTMRIMQGFSRFAAPQNAWEEPRFTVDNLNEAADLFLVL